MFADTAWQGSERTGGLGAVGMEWQMGSKEAPEKAVVH